MSQPNPRVTAMDVLTWHDNHYRRTSPETRARSWDRFEDIPDPYNPGNRMSGWVQRVGGDEYGTLIVSEVNGRAARQRIIATPKASYPYRKDRAWLLEQAESIRAFLKYDGTNICQYSYEDADGRRYTTFKLRGRPFIPPRFQDLLAAALARYPKTAGLMLEQGEAMIYELYGRHNPMLIEYDVDIELRSTCRRGRETGDMIPADPEDPRFARLDCPLAQPGIVSAWDDIHQEYTRRQSTYSEGLVVSSRDREKTFRGQEGEMLYVRFPDGDRSEPGPFTRLVKLKPVEIEEIHQASDFVPRAELEATVRNIFEAADQPDLSDFIMLLAEEWSDDQIGRSMETAERVLAEALTRRVFEDTVLEVFFEHFQAGDFYSDTRTVMRLLSEHHQKAEMQRVYGILALRLPYMDGPETRT